jgi:drug/metabolite transporter (DMT)-like permease
MFTEQPLQIMAKIRSGEVAEIGGASRTPVRTRDQRGRRIGDHTVPGHPPNHQVAVVHVALAFAAIYLIWGSTYLAIRYAVEAIPPLLMMGIRHFTAGTLLYAWVRMRGTPAPLRIHWKAAAVAGAIFFLGGHGTLAWAEQRVPSGLAALLNATLPLWIVLLTMWTGNRRVLTRKVLIGLLLGFAGVGVLIGPAALHGNSGFSLFFALVVLAGALLWAIGTIYTQRVRLPESASLSAAMQMMTGGLSLFAASLVFGERIHITQVTTRAAASLGYLIVFGSLIAFSAFTWLHKVAPAARISTYAYVNPVVAVFLGWMLAGEFIGARTIAATAIILAGVALVNRGRVEAPKAIEKRPEPLRNDYSVGESSAAD